MWKRPMELVLKLTDKNLSKQAHKAQPKGTRRGELESPETGRGGRPVVTFLDLKC